MAERTLKKRATKVPRRYDLDYYPSGMIESDSDDSCEVATVYVAIV